MSIIIVTLMVRLTVFEVNSNVNSDIYYYSDLSSDVNSTVQRYAIVNVIV